MRYRVMVAVAAMAGCGAIRPPEPDRRLRVQVAGTIFELDRGYRFGVLPAPNSNVVKLDVRYPVGEAHDPLGKAGLAHLVEHLLFDVEVTRGGRRTSIRAELGRLALSWNAMTSYDYTTYEVLAEPAALDELMRLEVDRLAVGCAGLTPEIVAREREVVLNELRQRYGASGSGIIRIVLEAVYPEGHPYRVIDSVESVAKLELKDVCDFLAGPYRSGTAFVVASGAVDEVQVQKAASRHFVRLPRRLAALPPVPAVTAPRPGTIRHRADVDEPQLVATWPLPPRNTHAYRMLELVWPVIEQRLARLASTARWGRSADAHLLGGTYAPVLAVSVTLTSPASAGAAIEAIKESVEHVLSALASSAARHDTLWWHLHGHTQAESLLANWESLSGRNRMFADFLQFDRDKTLLVERVKELHDADPWHVHELGEKWLDPSRARFLVLEPSGVPGARGPRTYAGGAEGHRPRVDPALADQPLPLPSMRLSPDVERYRFGNGLKVVLWPHGNAPLIHGRLVVDSGSAHDPPGREGISHLVGADGITRDSMVFTARRLATRADDLVTMTTRALQSPSRELRDDKKRLRRSYLDLPRVKERVVYERDLAVALYGGGHPYTRPWLTAESLDGIHRDQIASWARSHIVARNATLIIAGNFDPALIRRHIAHNTDGVRSGSDSLDLDAPVRPRQAWIGGTEAKPSPTVMIDIAFVGGRGIDADHAKRFVLQEVLNEALVQLRERRALTYGFSAGYSPQRAGGWWRLSGQIDASRAAEAATLLVTILDELRRDPESYRAAFVLARQRVLQRLLLGSTNSDVMADRLVEIARFDLTDNFYDRLADQIAGLTLKSFHPFVARELAVTGQVFGAFGNADIVRATLAAARSAR